MQVSNIERPKPFACRRHLPPGPSHDKADFAAPVPFLPGPSVCLFFLTVQVEKDEGKIRGIGEGVVQVLDGFRRSAFHETKQTFSPGPGNETPPGPKGRAGRVWPPPGNASAPSAC